MISLILRPFHDFQHMRENSGRPGRSGDVIRRGCISLPISHAVSHVTKPWPCPLHWRVSRDTHTKMYATASQTASGYITRSTRPSRFLSRTLKNMERPGYEANQWYLDKNIHVHVILRWMSWDYGHVMYFPCRWATKVGKDSSHGTKESFWTYQS